MDIYKAAERLMAMDDAAWARHANPLSVWSRMSCLPLICLAIWSRDWLGWGSLIPLGAAIGWTAMNPRLFPPPQTHDSWAAKATLGERRFLARHKSPIPKHHLRAAFILTGASALGMVPVIYGLWNLALWPTLTGLTLTIGAKLWFCDRMVWIEQDAKSAISS